MTEKNRGGRPTTLTDDLIDQFVEKLGEVPYLETAAALLSVGESTVYAWIDRADREKAQGLTGAESVYIRFADAQKKARANQEALLLQGVQRGSGGNWQNLAWILERTRPSRYGRLDRAKLEISGAGGAPLEHTVRFLALDDGDDGPGDSGLGAGQD